MSTDTVSKQKKSATDRSECILGRQLALQMLYAFEQKQYDDDQELFLEEDPDTFSKEAQAKAKALFDGFCVEKTAIDACVDKRLQNWTLHRLAVMDRAVLRLGCYELIYCADVPPSVIINEYIELAKCFGSEERTAKLVNGVLDKIAREHRPDEVKPKK